MFQRLLAVHTRAEQQHLTARVTMVASRLARVFAHSRMFTPYAAYFLVLLANFLLEVPTVRMVEHAACHQLTREQGILSVIYFGGLADKNGHHLILTLSRVGNGCQ